MFLIEQENAVYMCVLYMLFGTCGVLLFIFLSGGGSPPKPLSDVAITVQEMLGGESPCIEGVGTAPRLDVVFNQLR